eukprot:g1003.t1
MMSLSLFPIVFSTIIALTCSIEIRTNREQPTTRGTTVNGEVVSATSALGQLGNGGRHQKVSSSFSSVQQGNKDESAHQVRKEMLKALDNEIATLVKSATSNMLTAGNTLKKTYADDVACIACRFTLALVREADIHKAINTIQAFQSTFHYACMYTVPAMFSPACQDMSLHLDSIAEKYLALKNDQHGNKVENLSVLMTPLEDQICGEHAGISMCVN